MPTANIKVKVVCNQAVNQVGKKASNKQSKFVPFQKAAGLVVCMFESSNRKAIIKEAKKDVVEEDRLAIVIPPHGSPWQEL